MTKVIMALLLAIMQPVISWADDVSASYNQALAKAHKNITKDFQLVEHILASELDKMETESYILFDVRQRNEFAVSHIENAIWIDPATTADEFLTEYAELIENKTLVLYCSVGARSSNLAQQLIKTDAVQNSSQIYNLERGIFGWHNESRPLVTRINEAEEVTDYVHPYNVFWGRMVNRKALKRYKPE